MSVVGVGETGSIVCAETTAGRKATVAPAASIAHSTNGFKKSLMSGKTPAMNTEDVVIEQPINRKGPPSTTEGPSGSCEVGDGHDDTLTALNALVEIFQIV